MPQRYVVAVSGGVDSVVLLDALCNGRPVGRQIINPIDTRQIIVAHFDHGIREDSADDAAFVATLAAHHGVEFYTKREELGAGASEELARDRRYGFLHTICQQNEASLMTAHHADDIVETVAINISRGTGWRGLAVMDNEKITRPLLNTFKAEIHEYAEIWQLEWREDSTNESDDYLRNRIRQKITQMSVDTKLQIMALRAEQVGLKLSIDSETAHLISVTPYSRYMFSHCGDSAAIELLRAVFMREIGTSPTIVIRQRLLHDIKVARHGATINVASGVDIYFTRTDFVVRQTR